MQYFVPNQFKKKGQGWRRKLKPKEKRQLAKYAGTLVRSSYKTPTIHY